MGKNDKGSQRAELVKQYRGEVLRQLNAINHKLNMLIENAGMGDKLRALTEELRGPTDSLQDAVERNQPTTGV